ncbi:MAG: CopG family transcriptional regulator [Actinomyces succiniciruminis]|nr:CopG family transcriptional regulator [Actinomyces succiniciruminis]
MKTYTTKSGRTLTEGDIEALARAAERGDFPGEPGAFVVGPPGRPRLSEEELVTVAFKVPRSRREALDRRAQSRGETRSQLLREILERELAS